MTHVNVDEPREEPPASPQRVVIKRPRLDHSYGTSSRVVLDDSGVEEAPDLPAVLQTEEPIVPAMPFPDIPQFDSMPLELEWLREMYAKLRAQNADFKQRIEQLEMENNEVKQKNSGLEKFKSLIGMFSGNPLTVRTIIFTFFGYVWPKKDDILPNYLYNLTQNNTFVISFSCTMYEKN